MTSKQYPELATLLATEETHVRRFAQTPTPDMTGPSRLYLDLLKRSLTNTLFNVEPDSGDTPHRYVAQAIDHYQNSSAVSMLPLARLDNLEFCIRSVVDQGVPGDLIETGVWRGGATIYMRAVLKVLNCWDRNVWVADSFEGLPEPDAEKYPLEAQSFRSAAMTKHYKHMAASLEDVEQNFKAYGLLDENVRFLKGWFKDTLPKAPLGQLAVMRLDGDYYESTMDSLSNLYPKLSVGGYVIIDDYGEDHWTYCRKAVTDYRRRFDIEDEIVPVDNPCAYWRKSRQP